MHLLAQDVRSLDQAEPAVDLAQSPAEIVFLSFTDSDLGALAATWRAARDRGDAAATPSLRVASLGRLKHPYSVDLYLDQTAARARFVLIRCLGGMDYWRYGIDEISARARAQGFQLAVVPGDHMEDPRLDQASTVPVAELRRLWAWFQHGGPDNMASVLGRVGQMIGKPGPWREPQPLPPVGRFEAGCRAAASDAAHALILFYRSVMLAADTAPIVALADSLRTRGLRVTSLYLTSLKDPAAIAELSARLAADRPDVMLNTTAFSGRLDHGAGVLDEADAPVLQVILSTSPREAWAAGNRGLGATDLAMNVVLPEIDGRIITAAVSFKAEAARDDLLEYARVEHRPEPSRIEHVADLAASWTRLARTPRAERRIAAVLSDYPAKAGRTGYAVGLDTPASVGVLAEALRSAGYAISQLPVGDDLMRALAGAAAPVRLPLAAYLRLARGLPPAFRESVEAGWGPAAADPDLIDGAFQFSLVEAGNLIIAVQPDRGRAARPERKAGYHDTNQPPSHRYVGFYLWLRQVAGIDALIHVGTHGTLEWLPGKSVALDAACAPEVLIGAVPVLYPFIVNNPGEAAQAKRRLAAVSIGHMTPPLVVTGNHGAAAELEALFDEYAQAQSLDARRAKMLAELILARAIETGLAADSGVAPGADPVEALARLDAFLCDLKDMRIGDGLHVFGAVAVGERRQAAIDGLALASGETAAHVASRLDASAAAELAGLIAGLDGRFVEPGPAGAPSRGRLDVLPTGRNLYSIDPRAVPTRTAYEIGRRTAAEVMTRYAQDHGDWPRRIVIDLWGSATMRTGGDDLAQAFALIGVKPVWDHASARVSGFEVLPAAKLDRPRVDVTLRISGLFRDVFPGQIALFDQAVTAVAGLDEPAEFNPLAAALRATEATRADSLRVFGAAPGSYGLGLTRALAADPDAGRNELGRAYLDASGHGYGVDADGVAAGAAFRDRVAGADAFVHVQDMAEQDVLDADAFAEHEGGFAAAAAALKRAPALYHADTTKAGAAKVRSLAEEIARVVRGRATNPRWIAGQMRHGHRGAAEIAETVDNLFAFAVTTDAVASRQFDLVFDATLGDDAVRAFLLDCNPAAARAIAATFAAAQRRGLWRTLRNSSSHVLAELIEDRP